MPHLRRAWVVRVRVPLRDQPPANRFGDRLRAVDRSELRADRPQMFVRPMFGNIHNLANFPIAFSLSRPLQSLALAWGQGDVLAFGRRFLLQRNRAPYGAARDKCQYAAFFRFDLEM